jgi:hypothetical protein
MMIEHAITHHFQPTNFTCGHTALCIVLSHYGHTLDPESLIPSITAFRDDSGDVCGTLTTWMCSWALRYGCNVELYCSDSELLDLSWGALDTPTVVERMKLAREERTIKALDRPTIQSYFDSYLEFIELGGKLSIAPYISTQLLDDLLSRGPVIATFAYSVLYGIGRTRSVGLRESVADDLKGATTTHAAVIYGRRESGDYLIADPYIPARFHVAPSDAVIAAIAAASYTCESCIALVVPTAL